MTFNELFPDTGAILVWGLCATVPMTTLLEAAQFLGLSRMSLPFLFGTFMTGNRMWAIIWGYVLYIGGGWLFAFFYAAIFHYLGRAGWDIGALVGFLHGLFLVTVLLPNLPYVHPRMASDYDGPTTIRILEPPGPFGLNYGWWTPLTTILAQTLFGFILGALLKI